MPLKKLQLKAGVNKENTRYTNENGWYDCDKVRFRQGTPEKIGGWISFTQAFLGVCRSLWNWATLGGQNLVSIGTNLKFYINQGGTNYDITPLRKPASLLGNNPFTGSGTTTVTVTDSTGGYIAGDFVTFSGATTVGGVNLNGEYQIQTVGTGGAAGTYTIKAASAVTGTGGGATVLAAYQINVGLQVASPFSGWGSGPWGSGGWGAGTVTTVQALRLWSQGNFADNLLFGPRGGGIYYWEAALGTGSRAINLVDVPGADADTPTVQNIIFVSDINRFVFAFGCDDYGSSTQDPMLIRWSGQESITTWTPAATNQAGSIRVSHGSQIVGVIQARQEILVWTDAALYSLQYFGAEPWWGAQLLADNISIISQNAAVYASGVAYWMGVDKFYKYDGRTSTLRCDLRQYIFSDINLDQASQTFCGTNEGFNEVWWFYCSANSTTIDKYVVYNYAEDIWYYGFMARTAWLDSGIRAFPMAATYSNNLVYHENGLDDNTTATSLPIEAYISSSEFDIDDGYQVGFVWRMLPDITFRGSTAENPSVTMYMKAMQNSGSGYNTPSSEGGSSSYPVAQTNAGTEYVIEEFTGQINTRVRGRQLVIEIRSTGLGVQWQLGSPRIDIRPDGRR